MSYLKVPLFEETGLWVTTAHANRVLCTLINGEISSVISIRGRRRCWSHYQVSESLVDAMAVGKAAGYGDLNSKITCLKGTLFCFNVVTWVSASVCCWLQWNSFLDLSSFFTAVRNQFSVTNLQHISFYNVTDMTTFFKHITSDIIFTVKKAILSVFSI